MKPKEYLEQLEKDVPKAIDDLDFAYRQGLYDGAQRMLEITQAIARENTRKYREKHPEKQSQWREQNREAYNEYHRDYYRRKKEQAKAIKEDVDKISTMN